MASSIARQPGRLGLIILLLALSVLGLIAYQALAPESPSNVATEISETGGSPQISEPAIPRQTNPAVNPTVPAATFASAGDGFSEDYFPGTTLADLSPVNPPDQTPPPPPPVTGTLSGRVWQIDIMDGTVDGISVYLARTDGTLTGQQSRTAADGGFSFPGLAPGLYKIYFLDPNGVYQAGWYGEPEVAGGTAIPVEGGREALITYQLRVQKAEGYGFIRGRVTDDSGEGVSGVDVFAYGVESGLDPQPDLKGHAVTDPLGYYTLQKLTAANGIDDPAQFIGYKIQFSPSGGHAGQWYQAQATHATAKIIPLDPGEEITGIDAVLDGGGTISGSVRGSGAVLPGARVDIYDASGLIADSAVTGGAGEFVSASLAPGSYRIQVSKDGFRGEWYNDKADLASSDPIFVIAGSQSSGIVIELEPLDTGEKSAAPAGMIPERTAGTVPPAAQGTAGEGLPVDEETDTGAANSGNVDTGEQSHEDETAPAEGSGSGGAGPGGGGSAADDPAAGEFPDSLRPPDEDEHQVSAERSHDQVPDRQAQAYYAGNPGPQLSGKDL